MKKQTFTTFRKHLAGISFCLASLSAVSICGYSFNSSSIQVEAASHGLAKFEALKSGDKNWTVSSAQEGGIGTFKSVNATDEYRVNAKFTDYKYTPGNLLSIKVDGLDITDEEIIIGYNTGNGDFIKLKNIVSQHVGYITLELPKDTDGIFKTKQPTLVRIKGKLRNATTSSEFSFGGFEIHKAGTLPSWDDGSTPIYDPYAEPKGIAVTYYDGIYSRGFAWSTDDYISESFLYIIKKTGSMSADNIDWSNAKQIKASMVERTDVDDKKWHVYKAHVLDLAPGATYFYKVGSETSGFSTVGTLDIEKSENEIDGVTFLHLTDCQEDYKNNYYRWADVLKAAYNKYPETSYIAFTGDLTNHSEKYLNMYHWIWGLDAPAEILKNTPISPSSGNHDEWDYSFTDRFDFNYADFMPDTDAELKTGGCYYYTYGKDILFINMNTNDGDWTKEFKAQKVWLNEVLENHKDYKWKVVQLHKGPMSTGDHSNNGDVEDYRDVLCPIFSKYKVDLVLQGHDHVYTRTASYPYWTENTDDVKNYTYEAYKKAGKVTTDYTFDGETRIWNLEPAGTHYVTINYCANKKYDPTSEDKLDKRIHLGINPISEENGCSSQPKKPMYGVVRIKGDILCYDAYTYDYDKKESTLFDTFSVDKGEKKDETTEEKTSEEQPTEELSSEEQTTEELSSEEQTTEELTSEEQTTEELSSEEQTTEELSSEEQTTEELSSEEQSTENSTEKTSEVIIQTKEETTQEQAKSPSDQQAQTTTQNESQNSTQNNTDTVSQATTTSSDNKLTGNVLRKNQVLTDKKSCGKYKITKLIKKKGKIVGGNVTYIKPLNKNCQKVTIKSTVKLNGVTFKITAINNNAFINCKKLKTVIIGANVTKIGTKAFYNCKSLKTINIKSCKIKFIGKNAFGKTNKNIKFTLAKKGRARTSRLIKKSK